MSVTVHLQSDGHLAGVVRVPSVQDAQYCVSQLHRRKLGNKRIMIAYDQSGGTSASGRNTPTPLQIRWPPSSSSIALRNELIANCRGNDRMCLDIAGLKWTRSCLKSLNAGFLFLSSANSTSNDFTLRYKPFHSDDNIELDGTVGRWSDSDGHTRAFNNSIFLKSNGHLCSSM